MILSKDRQRIVKVIGILLALQGLIWIALSLTGIIVKSSPPKKLKNEARGEFKSYEDYLSQIIYNFFMSNKHSCDDSVIKPVHFQAFLWVYLVLSSIWIIASLDQYLAIKSKKSRQSYITLVLGIAVLLTSVIDVVFVALLIRDYAKCNFSVIGETSTTAPATTDPTVSTTKSSCEISYIPSDCKLAKGIIMTVVARGYALWAMNVALGICLIIIGARATRTSALLAYGNNTIPRIKLPEKKRTSSPIDEMTFFGDNPSFNGSTPYMNSKTRNSTPVALNHKGQNLYY